MYGLEKTHSTMRSMSRPRFELGAFCVTKSEGHMLDRCDNQLRHRPMIFMCCKESDKYGYPQAEFGGTIYSYERGMEIFGIGFEWIGYLKYVCRDWKKQLLR